MPITPAGFGDAVTIALGEHYYPLRELAFADANADGVLDIAAISAVG